MNKTMVYASLKPKSWEFLAEFWTQNSTPGIKFNHFLLGPLSHPLNVLPAPRITLSHSVLHMEHYSTQILFILCLEPFMASCYPREELWCTTSIVILLLPAYSSLAPSRPHNSPTLSTLNFWYFSLCPNPPVHWMPLVHIQLTNF